MSMLTINIRIDADLKNKSEMILEDMGLNMTTAFKIFLKEVIRSHSIPFQIKSDLFYSESNQKALAESIKQFESGNTVVKTMDELREMENE
ncbi:type II toxin-antitoxin system RelB/DinJ family antitoxin [bacterium]|nr:type II toxin-antitoxin system RelB/DinJ family antitoxin [bacterium]